MAGLVERDRGPGHDQLSEHRRGHAPRRVPCAHVADLVPEQPCKLSLVLQLEQNAPRRRDAAPGKRVGVHVRRPHRAERIRHRRPMADLDQPLPHRVHVSLHPRLAQRPEIARKLFRRVFAIEPDLIVLRHQRELGPARHGIGHAAARSGSRNDRRGPQKTAP